MSLSAPTRSSPAPTRPPSAPTRLPSASTHPPAAPARLLVRLPNWVGDILMARSALHALRVRWPDAELVGMARAAHAALVDRLGVFDRIIPAPPAAGWPRAAGVWAAARAVRAVGAEAAVLLAPSFEAALVVRLAGIPRRIGQATDRRRLLLTDPVPLRPDAHRVDGYLDVARALDAGDAPPLPPLALTAADRAAAARFFTARDWPARWRPLFVNPAAAKTPRAWGADRFRALAERLTAAGAGPVVVHARPPFTAPPGWAADRGVAVVRDATLPQLAAILARCGLYVGNDSGPAHLAAAVGVPTVTIHGPSSPSRTTPRAAAGRPSVAVFADFACSPCRERFFADCPSPPDADGRPPCLASIEVETVVRSVLAVLGASRSGARSPGGAGAGAAGAGARGAAARGGSRVASGAGGPSRGSAAARPGRISGRATP